MLRQAQHERMWGAAIALLLFATPAAAQQVAPASPTTYQRAIAAGYKALTLCEGVFAAGRTEAQVAAVELRGVYADYDAIIPTLTAQIDRTARTVTVAFDAKLPPRRADWVTRFGCVVSPIGGGRIVPPVLHALPTIPGPADPRPWPMGDRGIAPKPGAALSATVAKAFDRASYGKGETVGVIVVRDGRIVAERYADGFGPLVPNRTWSVAKSMAGTLIGAAAQTIAIDPARPATIPEWATRGDPRQAITLDQLLRMASGLHSDSAGNRTDALYFGGTTVTEQATGWPIAAVPGTRFRYANNDILLAVRAVRAAMKNDDLYANWPTELFHAIGMQRTTTGADWQGNFMLSSQVWSTARDFARLGQFWLDDGVWQGKRLLPEGWMTYMTTPSGPQPGGDGPGYGATMWLFGPKQGLPDGSYAAQGNRGQYIMVIPSRKLIVVRRGEDPGAVRFDIARFTAEVIEATR